MEKSTQILNRMLLNSIVSRLSSGTNTTFDGKRNLNTALGYPTTASLTYSNYYNKYRRQDIAGRIVDIPVEASWALEPFVEISVEEITPFEEQWRALEKRFRIYNTLARFDRLIGLGRYAVLLIGLADNLPLEEPVQTSKTELLYLQPYSEDNAVIDSFDTNPQSSRFNLPEYYRLQVSSGNNTITQRVHHSRVIHGIEFSLESAVYGFPRLERVYNRLLNLELIIGGSAEMFWQGAFPGMAITPKDNFSFPTDAASVSALEDEIEKYVHQMQRYMKLDGLDVQKLSSDIQDPSAFVDTQIKMISIASGIPKRILEGSERGELASSQDEKAWLSRIHKRRENYINPTILEPLLDKLRLYGVLPNEDYKIEWPDLTIISDSDKAAVGKVRTEAITAYTSDLNAAMYVPFESFLAEILELDKEKIARIMDAVLSEQNRILIDESNDDSDASII